MVAVTGCCRSSRSGGYTLVALLVLVTVVSVVIAAALPTWSQVVKRGKEAELIFRGLQYAEAIRVFQVRQGRYPTSLRELREIEPRSIRQLWTDPFNDDGEWGLILAESPQRRVSGQGAASGSVGGDADDLDGEGAARRQRRSRQDGSGEDLIPRERVIEPDGLDIPRAGQVVARGPIIGIRSLSSEEGVRTFMGATRYSDWLFTADLLPALAQPALGENIPRLHSEWVGRTFPSDIGLPESGGMPSDPFEKARPRDRDREQSRDLTKGPRSRRRRD